MATLQPQHGEHIPVTEGPAHRLPPRYRAAGLEAGQVELTGKGQANERPEEEREAPLDRGFTDERAGRHAAYLGADHREMTARNPIRRARRASSPNEPRRGLPPPGRRPTP